MGYVCKGKCVKYKFDGTMHEWYKWGAKRCSACEIYITVDGFHCPCCGCALRARVRNTKRRRIEKQRLEYVLV